jgi:hypothetical protein
VPSLPLNDHVLWVKRASIGSRGTRSRPAKPARPLQPLKLLSAGKGCYQQQKGERGSEAVAVRTKMVPVRTKIAGSAHEDSAGKQGCAHEDREDGGCVRVAFVRTDLTGQNGNIIIDP